ncbi:HD-GYP domain-containing protein [Desulfohalovibrio reitneri]|uniref:HD-GYP domain-containing protein n=1 Tax=Desulfohalovibrio reitneri TaxID=1307759 RepID=UPI0004A6F48A|nr:HD-GYP domain-containing protein [Desulfohalovibrio reitneri]
MAKFSIPEYKVKIDQLQPGVYIRLEGHWFEHPFLFTRFKIKSEEQIRVLRDSGVEEVTCVPAKSDRLPISRSKSAERAEAGEPEPAKKQAKDPATERFWKLKKERIEKLKTKRDEIKACEEKYRKSAKAVPGMMDGVLTGSAESVEQAGDMIADMVDVLLNDRDAVVHLMGSEEDESLYYHSLNVSVLALMLGKDIGLGQEDMSALGLGCLFHDVGKNRIDKKILKKKGPLTKPEQELLHLHPRYGVEIALKTGAFPEGALRAIFQHHEAADGSGYPKGFTKKKTHRLARVASIANVYDNLVNDPLREKAMTPYQAMSFMFAKLKNKLDMDIFSSFIRCLGIYPPGTICQLSNEAIGLVISVNQRNPLKPSLLLFDPEVPREEAVIFDMEDDPELGVLKSIHPQDLPKEIFDYLNPSTEVAYFTNNAGEKPSS